MNIQVLLNLLEVSIRELPLGMVREFLERSLAACKERDWKRMSETAQDAKRRARIQDDRIGEAGALTCLGIAFVQTNRVDDARKAFERARRIYRRDPDWRHRLGEGLATCALGFIDDCDLEAMNYHRHALNLLAALQKCYAAEGNDSKRDEIQRICEVLRLKVSGKIPIFYIDEMLLDLQPDVEYRVIPIGRNRYSDKFSDFGVSSGDCVLVRRIRDVDEIVPGGLGVWYAADGEHTLGRFERDAEGNIRFIQIGAERKSVSISSVHSVRRVDAILKPTRPPT